IRLPATGRGGASAPIRSFLNLPVFAMNALPAPSPTAAQLALFATDSINCASRMNLKGDLWCNGSISFTSRQDHTLEGDVIAGGNVSLAGDGMVMRGNIMAKGMLAMTPTSRIDGVTGDHVEYYAPMLMPALPTP